MHGATADQEENQDNGVVFLNMNSNLKLITGGGSPPTTTGNWLRDLADGTVFFARNKVDFKDFQLVLFRLEGKAGVFDKVVCLRNPNIPKEIYVDPSRFCNIYDLHHTEGVMKIPEPKEQEETQHDDSDRFTSPQGTTEKDLA